MSGPLRLVPPEEPLPPGRATGRGPPARRPATGDPRPVTRRLVTRRSATRRPGPAPAPRSCCPSAGGAAPVGRGPGGRARRRTGRRAPRPSTRRDSRRPGGRRSHQRPGTGEIRPPGRLRPRRRAVRACRARTRTGRAPDPWAAGPGRFLLHGLIFALPGLGYALAAPLLSGPPDAVGLPSGAASLTASALVGWAWNQAVAHRAYLHLAAGGRDAARRCLRLGATAGRSSPSPPPCACPPRRSTRLRRGPVGLSDGGHRTAGARRGAHGAPRPGADGAGGGGPDRHRAARGRPRHAAARHHRRGDRRGGRRHRPGSRGVAALTRHPRGRDLARAGGARRPEHTGGPAARPREVRAAVRGARRAAGVRLRAVRAVRARLRVLTTAAALGDTLRHGAGTPVAGHLVIALTVSMGAAEWLLYRCRGWPSPPSPGAPPAPVNCCAAPGCWRCAWWVPRRPDRPAVRHRRPVAGHRGRRAAAGPAPGARHARARRDAVDRAAAPGVRHRLATRRRAAGRRRGRGRGARPRALDPVAVHLTVCGAAAAVLTVAATALLGRITAHR
ncbi:hypothetical protein NKH77_03250 [Streptomyces sp. M19]